MAQENTKIKLNIFQRIDKFGDLFFLNLIFIISCIPIFTIGAAFTALYSYTLKLVDDVETTVWKGYWKAFKKNFKDATRAWIVVMIIIAIMALEYMAMLDSTGMAYSFFITIIALEAIYLSFVLPFLFPMIARYENTTRNMFRNALILALTNLGTWFYLFFIWMLPIALYASNNTILYYSWFLWVFLFFAVLAYAGSMVLKKFFSKVEAQMEENAKKAEEIAKEENASKDIEEDKNTSKGETSKKKKSIAVNYNNPADDEDADDKDTDDEDANK